MDPLTEKCRLKYISSQKKDDESHNEYYARIKSEFIDNALNKQYTFKGLPIIFKTFTNKEGEVECFYHTITAQDKDGTAVRKKDVQRYRKCLLVFVILDHCTCNHIQCPQLTIKPDYNNDDRISIYCAKYEFVIILEKKPTNYEYVTGFPVSKHNVDKYL